MSVRVDVMSPGIEKWRWMCLYAGREVRPVRVISNGWIVDVIGGGVDRYEVPYLHRVRMMW